MTPWQPGTRVTQPTYGPGTVVESTIQHTVVDFDEGGRQIFATAILVLKPIAPAVVVPPPASTSAVVAIPPVPAASAVAVVDIPPFTRTPAKKSSTPRKATKRR